MRKIGLICFIFLSVSCVNNSRLSNLRSRFGSWMSLLSISEIALFKEQKFLELGESISRREQGDIDFATRFLDIKSAEAILTFDAQEVAHFFYYVILQDLLGLFYQDFLALLGIDEKKRFAYRQNFELICTRRECTDFLLHIQKKAGLLNFTHKEILLYYRDVCFSRAAFSEIYNILIFFAERQCMDAFLSGQFSEVLAKITALKKASRSSYLVVKNRSNKDLRAWNAIKERIGLTNVLDYDVLTILTTSIIQEMDPMVFDRTVYNVKSMSQGIAYDAK